MADLKELPAGLPKLSDILKEGPKPSAESKNEGREDLIRVFGDFENKDLPPIERMEALKLFFELASKSENPFK